MAYFAVVSTTEHGWKISPDRSGYTIFCWAFAALAKWYL